MLYEPKVIIYLCNTTS